MLDLIEIGDRVKSMDIVCLSQGNFFYYKSLGCSSVVAEVDMLRQVLSFFYYFFYLFFILFYLFIFFFY